MLLTLQRYPSTKKATNGQLFIDEGFFCYTCYTLEDVVREPGVKVYGETAIPAGVYKVTLEPFRGNKKRMYPYLHNVPGFTGICIHGGNRAEDSLGCILVGEREAVDWVGDCKPALERLCERIKEAIDNGETVKIEIKNAGSANA